MPTRWAIGWPTSSEAARRVWPLSKPGAPPRPQRGPTGPVEGGCASGTRSSGHRPGELELESGTRVRSAAFQPRAGAQQLSELPAPFGLCAEAPEEAAGEG